MFKVDNKDIRVIIVNLQLIYHTDLVFFPAGIYLFRAIVRTPEQHGKSVQS